MHGMILALLYDNEIEPIVFKNKLKVFRDEYKKEKINMNQIINDSYKSLIKIEEVIRNEQ